MPLTIFEVLILMVVLDFLTVGAVLLCAALVIVLNLIPIDWRR